MTRVDFYVLNAAGEQSRWQFACRLAEKAYRLDNTVHVHVPNRPAAERLDELLWTWRDGSFVPHGLSGSDEAAEAPVTIGFDAAQLREGCDLLINLDDEVPAGAGAFPRLAEIVTSDEDTRLKGRARFSHYREQGYTLETHKL